MVFRTVLFLLLLPTVFFGQDTPPPEIRVEDEVVKIETRLVEVPIVVTDKSGKPLLNLRQSNFDIYENGVKQEITEFFTTNEPFEVALLLDTSGSTRNDLRLIRRAASNFIASLRVGDKVAIIAFTTNIEDGQSVAVSNVITPLTDNRTKLESALESVTVSNGTPYYDGMLQIFEKVFKGDQSSGRRAIVAMTDGVDSTSLDDFDAVRSELSQSGVVAYFVKIDTREFFEEMLLGDCTTSLRFSTAQLRRYYRQFERNSKMEKVSDFCRLGDFERLDISKHLYELADREMSELALMSGGKVFPAVSLSEARSAFTEVAAELGTKYSLGYYSTNQKHDGTYRRIKVELKGVLKDAQFRAREGYTAPGK